MERWLDKGALDIKDGNSLESKSDERQVVSSMSVSTELFEFELNYPHILFFYEWTVCIEIML